MIKDNRGGLVNTPRLLSYKNIQARRVDVNLDSLGNAAGEMLTKESGAELENLIPEIWSSKKDQTEIIQRKYRIPGIVFNGFEYKVDDESEPKASEKVVFKVNGFASQTGRRLFIPFNPIASIGTVPAKSKKRVTDVEIDECFTHFDTVTYTIPKGFNVEFLPKSKTISGLFGSYNSSVTADGDKLITIRKYQQNRGKYPAKEFNSYVDFLLEISKQDKQTIVLVHK
jgi:hypothetical protein